jgi:hypothetical protein
MEREITDITDTSMDHTNDDDDDDLERMLMEELGDI